MEGRVGKIKEVKYIEVEINGVHDEVTKKEGASGPGHHWQVTRSHLVEREFSSSAWELLDTDGFR